MSNYKQGRAQTYNPGYHKKKGIHNAEYNGQEEGEKRKVDKEIGAELKVFIRNPVLEHLIGEQQYYEDQKKDHGFGKRDALEEENNISTGKATQEKLNKQRGVLLIGFQPCIFPAVVVGKVKNVEADGEADQVGEQYGVTVPAIDASQRKTVPDETADKEITGAYFLCLRKKRLIAETMHYNMVLF
ncbi:MAG: hypothetical protein U5J63_10440 [Fodinibius sp.]|nr:hypothetical protein [Fodinibius sp.]